MHLIQTTHDSGEDVIHLLLPGDTIAFCGEETTDDTGTTDPDKANCKPCEEDATHYSDHRDPDAEDDAAMYAMIREGARMDAEVGRTGHMPGCFDGEYRYAEVLAS